jgi:putative aldouronate transport system permease protein
MFNVISSFQVSVSIWSLIFGFPAPIILALLINEIKNKVFKRTVQTISYMPYFISLVVMCSLIKFFTQSDGLIPDFLAFFGVQRTNLLASPGAFIPIMCFREFGKGLVGIRLSI